MSETLREAVERLVDRADAREDAARRLVTTTALRAALAEHPARPAEVAGEVAEGEREALAGVLAAHRAIVSGDVDGWHVICHCGFKAPGVDTTAHIAGALSDWLAAHDAALTAKARAEAWDEAVREVANVDPRAIHNPYRSA